MTTAPKLPEGLEPRPNNAVLVPASELRKLQEDAARMDWLMQHTVNVRVHMRYGSRNLFWAGPEEGDGEILPSDLRDRIDSALLAAKEAK
jgi:hypothetical protein